jgi:N-acetylglucosamine-6-phosphate deacetylase
MPKTITAGRLYTANEIILAPRIEIDSDGIILAIQPGAPTSDQTTLTASFFDIHIHGAVNHDVMQPDPSGFAAIERFLASRGVGHYLPTTVTAPIDETLHALDRLADLIESSTGNANHSRATAIGIHLEGPFISHIKRGVHPPENIQPPNIQLFDRLQQAARGHVRLITVAPEVPGALDLIEHATSRGVRVSLGHTNALAAEAHAAIAKGASSATHTFNAMRAIDHREPGVAVVVLANRNLFAELICDGIHVAPEMVEVFLRAKGLDRAILVTDGMSAAGMGDGTYKLGNFDVEVRGGRAMARGVLAGSVLTMDQAIENFARFTGTPIAEVTRCASRNPAQMLGLEDRLAISPGQPANLNRFNANGQLIETLLAGAPVTARSGPPS